MSRSRTPRALPEVPPDPFRERDRSAFSEHHRLLGGRFRFEASCPKLHRVVQTAYAGLPAHAFDGPALRFDVKLMLTSQPHAAVRVRAEPPRVRPLAGGGILCGAMDSANFVAIAPEQRSALVVVSPDMLAFPYHIRYELLEFAVYVLAARVQKLVPLHAACVGADGRGVLLLGPSGSGKSTVTLHGLLQGLEFLAEDSVLVRPDGLQATGVANFLHVRADSLRFLTRADRRELQDNASSIRRRSGVEKLEIDLRRGRHRLARAPLRIGSVVFVSPRNSRSGRLLVPVGRSAMMERLAATQQYAVNQPGWSAFSRQVRALPAFELRRGRHPREATAELSELIARLTV